MKTLHLDKEYHVDMGTLYEENYFIIKVKENTEAFVGHQLLFRFVKHVVDNKKWFPLLETCFDTPLLISDHRKTANGVEKERIPIRTGIIGFYDRLTPQQKIMVGAHKAGRRTAFTRHRPREWKQCLPFLRLLSQHYRKTCPVHYRRQENVARTIEKDLRSPHTVFTTATVNQNWNTRTHTDKGDFQHGMSCIAVLGNDGFRGCALGFPKRKLLVYMEPGDVILMDSHEPHCNTPLRLLSPQGKRLSLVCYLREDLPLFHTPKVCGDQVFYVAEKLQVF